MANIQIAVSLNGEEKQSSMNRAHINIYNQYKVQKKFFFLLFLNNKIIQIIISYKLFEKSFVPLFTRPFI